MNTPSFTLLADEYITAAPDAQLTSPQTHLLQTLLSEEDQLDYNQLLTTTLPKHIIHILHQVTSYLSLSSRLSSSQLVLFTSPPLVIDHVDNHDSSQETHHSTT